MSEFSYYNSLLQPFNLSADANNPRTGYAGSSVNSTQGMFDITYTVFTLQSGVDPYIASDPNVANNLATTATYKLNAETAFRNIMSPSSFYGDPSFAKKEQKRHAVLKTQNTFEAVAREWHGNQLEKWTPNSLPNWHADVAFGGNDGIRIALKSASDPFSFGKK